MAHPHPSSPTSLLWAHQLKRENAYLLNRLKKLEAANESQAQRLRAAEAAAKHHASEDLAALAEKVQALDESGMANRFQQIEQIVMSRLREIEAGNEAIAIKVASLERDETVAEDERRRALNKEKTLLKRLADVEESLKQYEEWRTKLQYQVDGEGLTKIRGQLEDLAEQVKREGAEMRFLEESVMAMERVNIELRKAVEGLRVEFAAKVEEPKKPAQPEALPSVETETAGKRPALASVQTNEEGTLTSEEPSPKKKKKSHKWAGGGADRDIIAQGTQLELTPRTQQQATPRSQAAASAAKRLGGRTAPKAALKPAKKTSATAPAPKQSQKPPAKAAPKPQQRMTANMPARKAARTPAPKLSSSKKSSTHLTESERRVNGEVVPGLRDKSIPDVPILRSGKGWFVVSMTEEEEQEWKEKDRQRFKTINDEVKAKKAAKYGEVEGRAQAMAGVDEDDEVEPPTRPLNRRNPPRQMQKPTKLHLSMLPPTSSERRVMNYQPSAGIKTAKAAQLAKSRSQRASYPQAEEDRSMVDVSEEDETGNYSIVVSKLTPLPTKSRRGKEQWEGSDDDDDNDDDEDVDDYDHDDEGPAATVGEARKQPPLPPPPGPELPKRRKIEQK